MNENKDYITSKEDAGSINISEEVIAAIAATAMLEVEGVAAMAGNIGSVIAGMLGKKSISKGIKIVNTEEGMKINASILVKFGCVVTDVAKKAQETAVSAIEDMTGLKVNSVNINVVGVIFDRDTKKDVK